MISRALPFLAALIAAAALTASALGAEPATGPAGQATPHGAEEAPVVIQRFNRMLIDIMQRADELGYQGRFDEAARAVRETFDMPFMAAKTLGGHWRKLSEEEQARWVETFEAFTISSYADKFDGFSGERIEIVGQKPASRRTLVVRTRLIRPDDDDVDLDYRMREIPEGWRVVDIYSDGSVSEIALRRSEYAAVLEEGGIEKLIDAVARKTALRAARHS